MEKYGNGYRRKMGKSRMNYGYQWIAIVGGFK
jgi:hypothetical protein